MDNKRRVLWYSIINYYSNVIRGEQLNVGLLVNVPDKGEFYVNFLSENNSKLKSIVINKHDRLVYKSGLSYLKYLFDSINNNDLSFSVSPVSPDFISIVKSFELPTGFNLSNPKYAKVSSVESFIEQLNNTYIGENFLNEEYGSNSMIVKRKAASIIQGRKKLEKIVKSNIRIKPIKNLSKTYTIDFGYLLKNNVNLIHATPDKLSTAYDWLERMNFITDNFDNSDHIILLYDSNSESNHDGTLKHMIEYLESKDERVSSRNIFSDEGKELFVNDLKKIEEFAGSIEELEKIIA
ncbi:hypothetical protein [Enterococcus sp. LJL51]|uniref:hypothetical protein n=1 Tax=Enterococcus sp. LJL51 TaxID=3416656 RepID=UPI003CF12331